MNKKLLLIIGFIFVILLVVFFIFFSRKGDGNITVSQFTKMMQKTSPQGETTLVKSEPENNKEIQDVFLKVELSQPVNASELQVSVSPPIEISTFVKENQPNVVWIEPKGLWDTNTKYTVTINSNQLSKQIELNFTYTPRPSSDFYMDDKPIKR
ncbi:hypothetical protein A3K42_00675 [candidate division WWE3 bacterium RBG_13_37_7]|uniref:SbsA Ig-like domain-containing protein n=1 Tax=candidate division WWE3 bacterium RBG_13_37_7 TaxID=1802609 RepID=A0A1F4U2H5_UNCKA|nr:MAG: hypothetical protein A3K42_00675 [candidate division WWE3 bacterium RBG_13_37_7]